MNGIEASELYFEEYGLPMLKRLNLHKKVAVGLVGEGSECFGYDDVVSRDHDWGVSLCFWMSKEDYEKYEKELNDAYMEMPDKFLDFSIWKEKKHPDHRRGVFSIPEFYARFINLTSPPETLEEWRRIPNTFLATATNGKVFYDPTGEFTHFRNRLLDFYPEDLRLKKISLCCVRAAQSGQYNLRRSLKRGDVLSASHALMLYNDAIASLVFLLYKRYRPFYKWLYRALNELDKGGKLIQDKMEKALFLFPDPVCCEEVEVIAQIVVDLMRMQNLTTGKGEYLLPHALSIKEKIKDPILKSLPLLAE